MVEYRGYGGNSDAPSETGFRADAAAAIDFLTGCGIAPNRLVLYGESLGSGVAVALAAQNEVGALILEAPFTSVAEVAQYHYPFVPAAALVRDRFDSLSRIGEVSAPILVLHGGRDRVVPIPFWRWLSAAAQPAKRDGIRRDGRMSEAVKKVVLAYSGGLDTSVILRWLQETYRCEVVTFTADLGQGEELEPARRKAELLGAREIFVDDLREEFVRDFVFPMFRANALYEGAYLLGTSIARPLIAKRQIEIAHQVGADAVAHGATGKGNDQVRFELSYYALAPDIKVIAPWREWDLTSRTRLLDYAEQHQIPIAKDRRGEAPFSVDANLLHISAEGKVLEDPWIEPEEFVFSRTVAPENAPDKPEYIEIAFERGDPVAVDGEHLSPAPLLLRLNEIGGRHGVGRLDLVEDRFRGVE